jgi:transposase
MENPTLFVGIDVSNRTFDVSFLDAEARTVRPSATYDNDPQGWAAIRTAIVAAANLVGPDAVVVCGMESTSNMHKRLEQALRSETRRHLQVHVLNPIRVKHFARALLKDLKTDKSDSHLIALFLLRMKPSPQALMPELFEEFKEATRTRRRFVEERTDAKNRLHKLLRVHFPGYHKIIGQRISKRLLVVLVDKPSPQAIVSTSLEQLAAVKYGRGHLVGTAFAQQLQTLATQAPHASLRRITEMLIRTTAQRILQVDAILKDLDEAIEEMLDDLFPGHVLTSIPGLGKVSVAAILAEVADPGRFSDKTNFVGYTGLYPIVWESGEAKRRYRMTWKGNRMLKMTLLVASAAARQYNPVIASFYERLRKRHKTKKAAGGAIARKMAELVFTLLVKNEPWSAEKAMRGMQKAQAMLGETA